MPDDIISLFQGKKLYRNEVYPIENAVTGIKFPEAIDFWYEKTLYGRVDERGDVVYISSLDNLQMDKFKQVVGESQSLALNFVVDAFLAFKREFDNAKALGRLKSASQIKELTVSSAYINPDVLYGAHLDVLTDVFVNTFLLTPERNEKVEKFDDFLQQFIEFCERYAGLFPITKTAFIKSQYCTPLISGLVIEIVNENHNDDDKKKKWIKDPNYDFYARVARKYGFLVDKNAPWRLVANVTSPKMQSFMNPGVPIDYPPNTTAQERKSKYSAITKLKESYEQVLENYGAANPKMLFEKYYKKTYMSDIEEVQKRLVAMYKAFYNKSRSVKKIKVVRCEGYEFDRLDKLASKVVYREIPIELPDVKGHYPETYWNRLYFLIRLKEERVSMHKNKFDKIVKNINTLVAAGKKTAIFSNSTIDKDRALWYLNEAVKGFPKIASPEEATPAKAAPKVAVPADTGGSAGSTGAGLSPGSGGGGMGY